MIPKDVFAADRYWGASAAGNWNSSANWSETSGGAGGATVPESGDSAFFDAGGSGNCTINVNVAVDRIKRKYMKKKLLIAVACASIFLHAEEEDAAPVTRVSIAIEMARGKLSRESCVHIMGNPEQFTDYELKKAVQAAVAYQYAGTAELAAKWVVSSQKVPDKHNNAGWRNSLSFYQDQYHPLWQIAVESIGLYGKVIVPQLLALTDDLRVDEGNLLEQMSIALDEVGGGDILLLLVEKIAAANEEKNVKVLLSLLRRVAEKRWGKYNEFGDSKKRMTRFMAIEIILRLEQYSKDLPATDISLLPLCGNVIGQFPNIDKNIEPEKVCQLFIEWLDGEYWRRVKRAFMESCGMVNNLPQPISLQKEVAADATKDGSKNEVDMLIETIESWKRGDSKAPVAKAILRLGETKDEKALPVLIRHVSFRYSAEPEPLVVTGLNVDSAPPLSECCPAIKALRTIGPVAMQHVISRLAEIDETKGSSEVFDLCQVLLGITSRENAVSVLTSAAKNSNDLKEKQRLISATEGIRWMAVEK